MLMSILSSHTSDVEKSIGFVHFFKKERGKSNSSKAVGIIDTDVTAAGSLQVLPQRQLGKSSDFPSSAQFYDAEYIAEDENTRMSLGLCCDPIAALMSTAEGTV